MENPFGITSHYSWVQRSNDVLVYLTTYLGEVSARKLPVLATYN